MTMEEIDDTNNYQITELTIDNPNNVIEVITSGMDNVYNLATRFQTDYNTIKNLNPKIPAIDTLYVGEVVYVPTIIPE